MFTLAANSAKACMDTAGEHGRYLNTPQTAADMNSILDAIGQEDMYYWGFSYGTTLGQTYAQMYPERVTRLIIDGVSNLDEWYNNFGDGESYIDTDKIFSGFVEECFKAEKNCPLNKIKGQFFDTAADLNSYIDDYLKSLEEQPIPVYIDNKNYGSITRRSIVTNGRFT
jgi:pimeloyl-ACP methyl ester carboxylesterase